MNSDLNDLSRTFVVAWKWEIHHISSKNVNERILNIPNP